MLSAPPILPFVWLYFGLTLAVLAWVVCVPLTEPGKIFSTYARALERLPRWISYPLGLCELCFAGQIALWSFVIWNDHLSEIIPEGGQFIAWTIFCTYVIEKTARQ